MTVAYTDKIPTQRTVFVEKIAKQRTAQHMQTREHKEKLACVDKVTKQETAQVMWTKWQKTLAAVVYCEK